MSISSGPPGSISGWALVRHQKRKIVPPGKRNDIAIGVELHDVSSPVEADPNSSNRMSPCGQGQVIVTWACKRLIRQWGNAGFKRLRSSQGG
jgi:hypothetical protein